MPVSYASFQLTLPWGEGPGAIPRGNWTPHALGLLPLPLIPCFAQVYRRPRPAVGGPLGAWRPFVRDLTRPLLPQREGCHRNPSSAARLYSAASLRSLSHVASSTSMP